MCSCYIVCHTCWPSFRTGSAINLETLPEIQNKTAMGYMLHVAEVSGCVTSYMLHVAEVSGSVTSYMLHVADVSGCVISYMLHVAEVSGCVISSLNYSPSICLLAEKCSFRLPFTGLLFADELYNDLCIQTHLLQPECLLLTTPQAYVGSGELFLGIRHE